MPDGWLDLILAAGPPAILAAALIAWWVSVRRATIDFIFRHEIGSEDWRRVNRSFVQLISTDDYHTSLAALVSPSSPNDWERRHEVATVLNHFEAVAVAINKWAMSAAIYKEWNRTNYVEAWRKTKGYVTSRREEDRRPSAYIHFEKLAEKWAKEKPRRR